MTYDIQGHPLTFIGKMCHTIHTVTQEHVHTHTKKHADRMLPFSIVISEQQENGNNFTLYCNLCKTHNMVLYLRTVVSTWDC